MRKTLARVAVAVVAATVGAGIPSTRATAAELAEDLKLLRQELAKQRAYIEQLEKRVESQETKNEARGQKLPGGSYCKIAGRRGRLRRRILYPQ